MAHRDYIYTVVVYCTSSAYILCVQILYEPANIFRLPETVYKTFININLFTVNITFQCFFQIFLIYAMVFYITIKNFIMRICKIISYIMRYFAQLSYICRRNSFVTSESTVSCEIKSETISNVSSMLCFVVTNDGRQSGRILPSKNAFLWLINKLLSILSIR